MVEPLSFEQKRNTRYISVFWYSTYNISAHTTNNKNGKFLLSGISVNTELMLKQGHLQCTLWC